MTCQGVPLLENIHGILRSKHGIGASKFGCPHNTHQIARAKKLIIVNHRNEGDGLSIYLPEPFGGDLESRSPPLPVYTDGRQGIAAFLIYTLQEKAAGSKIMDPQNVAFAI